MDKSELELKRFFNLEEWERLLKSLSDVFKTAVIMLDYKGNMAFDPINCCDFCRAIMSNPDGKKRCIRSMTLGSLEAARMGKAFITHCHTGLSIGVVPIMADESFIGTVCFGQVLFEGETTEDRNKCILGTRSWIDSEKSEELKRYLTELFEKTQVVSKDKFELISKVMEELMRYTVGRTIELKNEKQTYELLKKAISPLIGFRSDVSESPAAEAKVLHIPASNQLYPVMQYIEQHPEEPVSLHEMAELCHLSPSYFSKLWLRNTGENFTSYVNHKKTELAKQMLLNSAESISFIASSLGFSDTSYFIKVFKKAEGVTPLAFRQHKYLQK